MTITPQSISSQQQAVQQVIEQQRQDLQRSKTEAEQLAKQYTPSAAQLRGAQGGIQSMPTRQAQSQVRQQVQQYSQDVGTAQNQYELAIAQNVPEEAQAFYKQQAVEQAISSIKDLASSEKSKVDSARQDVQDIQQALNTAQGNQRQDYYKQLDFAKNRLARESAALDVYTSAMNKSPEELLKSYYSGEVEGLAQYRRAEVQSGFEAPKPLTATQIAQQIAQQYPKASAGQVLDTLRASGLITTPAGSIPEKIVTVSDIAQQISKQYPTLQAGEVLDILRAQGVIESPKMPKPQLQITKTDQGLSFNLPDRPLPAGMFPPEPSAPPALASRENKAVTAAKFLFNPLWPQQILLDKLGINKGSEYLTSTIGSFAEEFASQTSNIATKLKVPKTITYPTSPIYSERFTPEGKLQNVQIFKAGNITINNPLNPKNIGTAASVGAIAGLLSVVPEAAVAGLFSLSGASKIQRGEYGSGALDIAFGAALPIAASKTTQFFRAPLIETRSVLGMGAEDALAFKKSGGTLSPGYENVITTRARQTYNKAGNFFGYKGELLKPLSASSPASESVLASIKSPEEAAEFVFELESRTGAPMENLLSFKPAQKVISPGQYGAFGAGIENEGLRIMDIKRTLPSGATVDVTESYINRLKDVKKSILDKISQASKVEGSPATSLSKELASIKQQGENANSAKLIQQYIEGKLSTSQVKVALETNDVRAIQLRNTIDNLASRSLPGEFTSQQATGYLSVPITERLPMTAGVSKEKLPFGLKRIKPLDLSPTYSREISFQKNKNLAKSVFETYSITPEGKLVKQKGFLLKYEPLGLGSTESKFLRISPTSKAGLRKAELLTIRPSELSQPEKTALAQYRKSIGIKSMPEGSRISKSQIFTLKPVEYITKGGKSKPVTFNIPFKGEGGIFPFKVRTTGFGGPRQATVEEIEAGFKLLERPTQIGGKSKPSQTIIVEDIVGKSPDILSSKRTLKFKGPLTISSEELQFTRAKVQAGKGSIFTGEIPKAPKGPVKPYKPMKIPPAPKVPEGKPIPKISKVINNIQVTQEVTTPGEGLSRMVGGKGLQTLSSQELANEFGARVVGARATLNPPLIMPAVPLKALSIPNIKVISPVTSVGERVSLGFISAINPSLRFARAQPQIDTIQTKQYIQTQPVELLQTMKPIQILQTQPVELSLTKEYLQTEIRPVEIMQLKQVQVQEQVQTPRLVPGQVVIPRIQVPETPIRPPRPTKITIEPKGKVKYGLKIAPSKKAEQGYTIQVKSRKKFGAPLAVSVPKEEAFALGARAVIRSSSATFKIIPTGRAVKSLGIRPTAIQRAVIRPGKKAGEFVQKERLRIISSQEVQQISLVGAAVRRGVPRGSRKKNKSMWGF